MVSGPSCICHLSIVTYMYVISLMHMASIGVLCGQHCMARGQDILMSMACPEVLGGERSEEDICGYREGNCSSDAGRHNVR